LIIPAKKLIVVALRDREEEVLRRLGELGIIQLKKPSERDVLGLTKEEEARLRELEKLYERLMEIRRTLTLRVSEIPEERAEQETYQRYHLLKCRLRELEAEENRLRRRLASIRSLIEIGEKEALEEEKFRDLLSTAGFEELSLKEISEDLKELEEVLQDKLRRICEEIQTVRHELEEIKASFIGFSPEEESRFIVTRELYERFMKLKEVLPSKPIGRGEEVEISLDEVKRIVEQAERYDALNVRLRKIEKLEEQLKEAREVINMLKSAGVRKLPKLGRYENLESFAGTISSASIDSFKKFASGKPIAYDVKRIGGNLAFIHVACLKDFAMEVRSMLLTLNFKEVKGLVGLPEDIDEARAMIEGKIRQLDEEKRSINKEIQEIRENFLPEAESILKFLSIRLKLEEALLKTMKSETMRVIQGWVPEDRVESVDRVLKSLREEFDGKLLYEFRDPSPDEDVPTALKNPRIFKAFETLVRQYGWPGHLESDPTIISGILWTIMFGMMFPDLGHGITIAILGLLFSRFLKKNILGLNLKRLGKLMIGLGIASAIFGALIGEFFLIETQPLLPTLRAGWLEDPAGVVWLLKIAVFFGIAQMLLALSISVRNHLRSGQLAEAILGERGVAGILLLLGLALTAFNFIGITVIPGVLEFPELGMKALTSWPFFMTVAGLAMILVKPFITREEKVMGVGLVLETFISLLANMFSYMRIAGFAIVHAALAMVVFRLMQVNPLMGIGVGLIFLNLFALTIEFLVCTIQALRLLYYEFMTKFYRGTGTPYSPWKL